MTAQTAGRMDAPSHVVDTAPVPGKLTFGGSVTLVTDYRYRGLSYSDNRPALQGQLTVSHSSGLYIGTFVSHLAGDGSYGGDNLETDILAGFTRSVHHLVIDLGIWDYRFPGTHQSYAELYGSIVIPIGRLTMKPGLYYAPARHAIGGRHEVSRYADFALPVNHMPVTIRAHAGYTSGKGSTIAGPSGAYLDYSIGADIGFRAFTVSAAYMNTSINRARADQFYPVGGRRDVGGTVVGSVTAAF